MPPALRQPAGDLNYRRERALLRTGVWPVAGVDEAGRGPLAGPVAAAAVILNPARLPRGVGDSKQLTARARELAYEEILAKAVAVSVGFSPAVEIDRINIRQATFAAMCRALHALSHRAAHVLVDGSDLPPNFHCPGETIVGGDARSLSIAAASIVAKVTRDRLMQRLHTVYPQYGFSDHMGYATRAHREAIRVHGRCALHRVSFTLKQA